ncbi:uncharacterized protein BO97DRAFT_445217 [Aspergillus homomorphus CBS 101889]|uniref:Uncharacterized protein n=1 Tax=Aspergillus homomorphus (strain CBS 101889) TaxID=1450537 RepID=A0A395HS73_ASPHC|nr:hypothetical protein BO97DRAFT_445217 [Aspergillus homomorphus CBS 101889]RAL09708.1 hypothetical protein BO97DRAFT_445217 [Aspergillus homomorphus CBS 101889]
MDGPHLGSMASHHDNIQPVLPRRLPEIYDLEIHNTWTGNLEDPVAVKISMEVLCHPNTLVPLLNTNFPGISLQTTSVSRVHSDHFGTSDQSRDDGRSPSPLSAHSFSVAGVTEIREELSFDAEKSSALDEGHVASEIKAFHNVESPGNRFMEENARSDSTSPQSERPKVTRLRTTSLQTTFRRDMTPITTPTKPPPVHLNLARSESGNTSQNLGKRSAAVACLPSSASDTESETEEDKKTVACQNMSHSAVSIGSALRDKNLARSPRANRMQRSRSSVSGTLCSSHSSRGPKAAPMSRETLDQALSDTASDIDFCSASYIEIAGNDFSSTTATLVYPEDADTSTVSPTVEMEHENDSNFTVKDMAILEDSLSEKESWRHRRGHVDGYSTPTQPGREHTGSRKIPTSPLNEKQQFPINCTNGASPHIPTKSPKDEKQPLRFGGTDGAADTESVNDSLDSSETPAPRSPSIPLLDPKHDGMTAETRSPDTSRTLTQPGSTEQCLSESPTEDFTNNPEERPENSQPEIFSEPELTVSNGIVYIKSPPNITPVPYKVVLATDINLQKGVPSGWSRLTIPGLPRLKKDDIGVFLFQTPPNHGLEFRTANLEGNKWSGDCFMAGFAYCGDLVIDLHRCNKGFYGIVKDFTVEQEIKADIIRLPDAADSAHGHPTDVCVQYQAFCSVKLPNRSFFAEKCCVMLLVDGGPEGFFRSELDIQETGLQVIQIEPEQDTPLGISTLQIICNPKDYEMFCISWTVKFSRDKAISWLPRVYPGPSGSNDRAKHYLRYTHLERDIGIPATNAVSYAPEGSPTETTSEVASSNKTGDLVSIDEETIIQCDEDAIVGHGQRCASLAKRVIVGMCCAGFAMLAIVWLGDKYANACSRSLRDISQPLVPKKGAMNVSTEVSQFADDETHFESGLQLNQTEPIEWKAVLSKEPSEQETFDVQVELEEAKFEAETAKEEEQQSFHPVTALAFRERMDNWLGWRGPFDPAGDRV